MKRFFRRLRGIIGTAFTWAIGWAGVTVALNLIGGVPIQFIGQLVLAGLVRGFIAGGGFSVVLSIAERRHTLDELSLPRVALWGGIGGSLVFVVAMPFLLTLGVPLGSVLGPILTTVLTGAVFASGSVALARKADGALGRGEDISAFLSEGD